MNNFEYYLKTDPKYHDEIYTLLQIIEADLVDDETLLDQEQAQERLDELVKLSENNKG